MINQAWLDQVQEDVIDPERPICDPHHHLWDYPGSRYLLDELVRDVGSGHNVTSTVFVECNAMYSADASPAMAPVGETEFVQGIAAMSASGVHGPLRAAAGIVGFADLNLGEAVAPVLAAHCEASANRFRGIRHAAGWFEGDEIRNSHTNPTPSMMLDDTFQAGFACLGEMGLSFDAWCYHYQLPELISLATNFPQTTIILDHFGGPLGIGPFTAESTFDEWTTLIAPLSGLDNVHFKLGGINMKINGFGWHQRDRPPTSDELGAATGRYYEYCIREFGAERCMFESNFPVDRESCSYRILWNAFKKMADEFGCSDADKDNLFHDTAHRVYRLS